MTVPVKLKPIIRFLRCADEYDSADPTVGYFCRMCAVDNALKLDPTSSEAKVFITSLIARLEEAKNTNAVIVDEAEGLTRVENCAWKQFKCAFWKDVNSDFSQLTIKGFYDACILFEVICTLRDAREEIKNVKKYSAWKAVYIKKCKNNGQMPIPGPGADPEFEKLLPAFLIEKLQEPSYGGVDNGPSTSHTPSTQPTPTQPMPSASVPPIAPQDESSVDDDIPFETYTEIENNIKYALSAIQHGDKSTTIKYLTSALNLLSR